MSAATLDLTSTPLLTHEVGSLDKPGWRTAAYAGKPVSSKDVQDDADRRNFDNETVKTSALGAPPMMQGQKPWNNP